MIANLPMYDLPWLRDVNDDLWKRLAHRLRDRGIADVPASLQRGGDLRAQWASPALLLGQTCGYPFVTGLRDKVRLVATPHYAAEGCEGPYHRAAILVRQDDPALSLADLRGRRAGVNSRESNSGMNLFRAAIAPVAAGPYFFGSVRLTGSHARSIAALLSDRIDVASIDAVTLALLTDRFPEHAERWRVLAWTTASPALPFVTAIHQPDTVALALEQELENLVRNGEAGGLQRINGFSILSAADYQPILSLEAEAAAYGYPLLL